MNLTRAQLKHILDVNAMIERNPQAEFLVALAQPARIIARRESARERANRNRRLPRIQMRRISMPPIDNRPIRPIRPVMLNHEPNANHNEINDIAPQNEEIIARPSTSSLINATPSTSNAHQVN